MTRLVRKLDADIWRQCAEHLGYEYSAAYGGYVHLNRTKPETNGSRWEDYYSDLSAEDACFQEGIETLAQAVGVLDEARL